MYCDYITMQLLACVSAYISAANLSVQRKEFKVTGFGTTLSLYSEIEIVTHTVDEMQLMMFT